jgi:predicted ester cyclase
MKGSCDVCRGDKAALHHWAELWNTGDIAAIGDAVIADFVRHDPNSPEVRSPEAEQQLAAMYLAAFLDLHFTIEDLIAEGDAVVVRPSVRATHQGELLGIPPTGSRITLTAIEWY